MAQNTEPVALRSLSTSEAVEDFDLLVTTLRTQYGPMEFKERRFDFRFDDLVVKAREQINVAKNDDEVFAAMAEFLANFRDGHVGIQFSLSSTNISQYRVPIFVYPVQDSVLVGAVSKEAFHLGDVNIVGIEVGDKVVLVDGQSPMSYLEKILKS